MEIYSFLTKYMLSLSYVVLENGHALLIDPCEMDEIKQTINNVKVDFAFLTHEHYDHISGVDWARSQEIKIVASDICSQNLGDARLNHSKYYGAFCAAQERLKGLDIPEVHAYTTHADICFSEDTIWTWQGHMLLFRKTPGHSAGSASLLINQTALFTGDAVFRGVPANIDLMCGDASQLEESRAWIASLPGCVQIYPGHYDKFSVQEMKAEKENTI